MEYDYLIIGGGVAGLYSAFQLESRLKNPKVLILEKNAYLGGRTRMETFHSHKVVTGAGVGRFPKDRLLQKLVEASTGKPVQPMESKVQYQFSDPVYTLDYIEKLEKKKKWIEKHRSTCNFKQFFLNFYSEKEYQKFCESNGYTDFEKADIVDTLYDYGFEDNVPGNHIFPVDWNLLVRYLRRQLHNTKVHLDTEFERYTRLPQEEGGFRVRVRGGGKTYTARNIIFAGSIEGYPFPEVHHQIGFNSFLRMYSFSSQKNDHLHLGGMTYYDNVTQKSVYLSPTIRMMSYSDNERAEAVMRTSDSELEKMIGYKYDDSKRFFWKRGTHYYKPLATKWKDRDKFIEYAQNPEPGIFLVGECISKNQGWTEGALESVLAVRRKWW